MHAIKIMPPCMHTDFIIVSSHPCMIQHRPTYFLKTKQNGYRIIPPHLDLSNRLLSSNVRGLGTQNAVGATACVFRTSPSPPLPRLLGKLYVHRGRFWDCTDQLNFLLDSVWPTMLLEFEISFSTQRGFSWAHNLNIVGLWVHHRLR